MRLRILTSRFQNAFFTELADVIAAEARSLGVRTEVVTSAVEMDPEDVLVVLPTHEYVTLEGPGFLDDAAVARRTIGLTAEQPGSSHFDDNVELGSRLGAVFDFSAHAVAAYRLAGVDAEHLPFGWTPTWDRFDPSRARGAPELLFLGAVTPRREEALAALARPFWERTSRVVLSDNSAPNHAASASFMTGEAKRDVLATTTLLVNIHQADEPYFEWLRVAEAMHCGAVVLTEPSLAMEPFRPGVELEVQAVSGMPATIDRLLDDEDALAALRTAAYDTLRDRPFSRSIERLVDVAHDLAQARVVRAVVGPTRTKPYSAARPLPWQLPRTELDLVRQAIRDIRLDLLELRRATSRLQHADAAASTTAVVRAESPASLRAERPAAVSVLMALYNHDRYVRAALDSAANCGFDDLELVIVDDGSTDRSAAVVEDWIFDNGDVRATLVSHPLNRGLPHARNTALAHATAAMCFVLDADNEIVPGGLSKLVAALESAPAAVFAYGMLQRFDARGAVGLLSYFPWEPERLRHANYIDAMALIRTAPLRELGGFAVDRRLHGWEDYDLWCRIAEHGGSGVHVPTIVGRYRTSLTSMLSLTNISVDAAFDAIRERAPRLMDGVGAVDAT